MANPVANNTFLTQSILNSVFHMIKIILELTNVKRCQVSPYLTELWVKTIQHFFLYAEEHKHVDDITHSNITCVCVCVCTRRGSGSSVGGFKHSCCSFPVDSLIRSNCSPELTEKMLPMFVLLFLCWCRLTGK